MATAVARPGAGASARGHLARAGWNVASAGQLPGLPDGGGEAEGQRLVTELASLWSKKYIFTIRPGGLSDGLYHYECLFSRPTDDVPVPSVVIAVRCALLPSTASSAPRLFYQFEEGDLRHEWSLVQDGGRWRCSPGQQRHSLKDGSFEGYLDSFITEKEKVRARGINLQTSFEASRLTPPPAFVHEEEEEEKVEVKKVSKSSKSEEQVRSPKGHKEQDEAAREMAAAMQDTLRAANMYCDKVSPPSSLRELLSNVFDAADEEGLGEMPHYEIARLLMATLPGFGLEEWDIHHLLTYAKETDEGYIKCKGFINSAQDIIFSLRKRRQVYKNNGLPGVEIPNESVKHCFSDEIGYTVDLLQAVIEACAQEGPGRALYGRARAGAEPQRAAIPKSRGGGGRRGGAAEGEAGGSQEMPASGPVGNEGGLELLEDQVLLGLKRRYCRECLASLPERLSPQEAKMLMQMMPEDENGVVMIDELADKLENLRAEALLNSVVASSVEELRIHLVTRFREIGLDENGQMKIWMVKEALLGADLVCLSRLQIHTLLCLTDPDPKGNVKCKEYLGICSAIIPHMSTARIFAETSEQLMFEHAEAAKERQNAELAALTAVKSVTVADGDDEPGFSTQKIEVDQETVERTLIQVFSLSDDTRKSTPVLPPETIFQLLASGTDQQVLSCGLDELEMSGLVAEMGVDANGEVPYHDFVKRWVPIIFELRKNSLLGAYLKDRAAETLGIPEPDLDALEDMYPLLPDGHWERIMKDKPVDPPPQEKKVQRRPSKGGAGRRSSSITSTKSLESAGEPSQDRPLMDGHKPVVKEPPPGRGYQRRKSFMEQEALKALQKAAADAEAPAPPSEAEAEADQKGKPKK